MATGRNLLEQQATKIESALAQHNVHVTARSGILTPKMVRFDLQPRGKKPVDRVDRLAGVLALALGVDEARVYEQGGAVHLETPRPEGGPIRLLPLLARLGPVPPATLVLGIDEGGAPLLLRLPSSEVANLLIQGDEGSGKSALLRSAALSLAALNPPDHLNMVLIDPCGHDLASLVALPQVLGDVATGSDAMMDCLRWLVSELERREMDEASEPHLVVLIDDVEALLAICGKSAAGLLARLALRGRETGIHLAAATSPSAAWIAEGDVTSIFPARVSAFGVAEDVSQAAQNLDGGSSARRIRSGDFLLTTRRESIGLRAAWASRSDVDAVIAQVIRSRGQPVAWSRFAEPAEIRFTLQGGGLDKGDPAYALEPPTRRSLRASLRRAFGRIS